MKVNVSTKMKSIRTPLVSSSKNQNFNGMLASRISFLQQENVFQNISLLWAFFGWFV